MAVKGISRRAFQIETGIFDGLAGLFILIFIGVTAYWVYEVYHVYEAPANPSDTEYYDMARDVSHAAAAFQAGVLSFLMAILSRRFGKRI